ncbi:MAG: amino acid ABC transporter permease [Oscillospiraceae bacterium]|nr:amino acid ABC transporter permease [Oscillospiraceae bacterium]MBP1578228.1 amino acid ABC transporter permease [Oscillospiraceae bacterium]
MLNDFIEIAVLLTDGVKYTLSLFLVTIIGSMPLGLLLTFMRTGKSKILRGITGFFVYIMRGTPLLLQLYFFYYGLPFIPGMKNVIVLDRLAAAMLAFVLNYAAYFCEIFRGGMLSVDKGQYEAARVLGFNKSQTLGKIVLPQMLRVSLPSIANEAITLVKDTALVTAIGVTEILYFAKATVNRQAVFTAYPVAAVFYLVFTFVITRLFEHLERKYSF